MEPRERFLFDMNGFLVLRGVLTPDEVAAANAAIDANASRMKARTPAALRNTARDTPLAAPGARHDGGGMLLWDQPHCEPFRSILAHPRLLPYLNGLLGAGYRLDHQPMVITQERDSEGFSLHGGPVDAKGRFIPELQYRCVGGDLWTSLLAVSVSLCDHGPGDGGWCVLRGSHKLNLPVPLELANGSSDDFAEHAYMPTTKAGDVIIWSEATVHGASPWRGAHQRRIALYRFAPGNMGYGRGYLEIPPDALEGMTPQQRAVLEPPYATRLERPTITAEDAASPEGPPTLVPRAAEKKEFDQQLFGTRFF